MKTIKGWEKVRRSDSEGVTLRRRLKALKNVNKSLNKGKTFQF